MYMYLCMFVCTPYVCVCFVFPLPGTNYCGRLFLAKSAKVAQAANLKTKKIYLYRCMYICTCVCMSKNNNIFTFRLCAAFHFDSFSTRAQNEII